MTTQYNNQKPYLPQRVFVLVVAILLCAALISPVVATRDVKVALPELRPSLFTDDQGKPAGLFVDLVEDIAKNEDWNVIWVHGTLSENWDRLSSGQIDLMPGVIDTPERDTRYDFNHEAVLSAWSQVYAPKGADISTILDLNGKRVALLKGDANGVAFRDYAKKFAINVTCIEQNTIDEVFAGTAAGNADAVVTFSIGGEGSATRYGLSETPVMFNPTSIVFAVPHGKNADLLAAIDRYLAEGKGDPSSTYSKSMQKWFGMKSTSGVIPHYIWWGLTGIAVLAALFVIMSIILRREVRKKTAELSRQNESLQSEIMSRIRAETELVRKNSELRGAYERLTEIEEELRGNYQELNAAYEQLTATEEELRGNYQELTRSERALMQARKKLNILNTLTFEDLQNAIFSLNGFIELAKQAGCSEKAGAFLDKGGEILHSAENTMQFAKKFQDLGISQPRWQNVNIALISALSHLDFSRIARTADLGGLEIYADPLLEDVFFNLMENVLVHGQGATEVRIRYQKEAGSLTIIIDDNGPGIPEPEKEKIFNREYKVKGGTRLFLAREILAITGITMRETGEPGTGARFEITVPEGGYRFPTADG